MKKTILLFFVLISLSSPAKAEYMVVEWLSFSERLLQKVNDTLSNIDFDEILGITKEERESQDPKADGAPAITENTSKIPIEEISPYTDRTLAQELNKDKPSIPAVENLIKQNLTFKSDTIVKGQEEKVSAEKASSQNNTLEKQDAQSFITYANARALARRTLDLISKADEDKEAIKKDKDAKTTTGSLYKTTAASPIFRTHMLLNEISMIRNSYLEILASDAMHGEEVPQSASDKLLNAAKGMVGK